MSRKSRSGPGRPTVQQRRAPQAGRVMPRAGRRSYYVSSRAARWTGGGDGIGFGQDWLESGQTYGLGDQPGGWGNSTPNANLGGFQYLIRRMRDLESFVPTFKGAIDIVQDEVLGKTGVLFNYDPWPGLSDATRYWYQECDYDEGHQLDFVGKQIQMVRMGRRDSNFIIRHIHQTDMSRVPMSRIPYQFQLLQIDHLPAWYSMPLPNGGYIHGGREFDANGKLIRYWMFPVHPTDFQVQMNTNKFPVPIPVNVSEITVVRDIGEPGSARTTPTMRTATPSMRDVHEFMDSEAVRMRNNSNTGLLISSPGFDDDEEHEEAMFGGSGGPGNRPGPNANVPFDVDPMEPGGAVIVPPGWKVEQTKPGDVGASFGEFLRRQDSRGAIGAGVPYGRYADDMGSYSSDRIAKIADRDFDVRMSMWRNQVLIGQALRAIGRRLVMAARISGQWEPKPGTDIRQVYSCAMHLPRRDNVHQYQGEQAEDLAVAAGRESADDMAAKRGKSGPAVDIANAVAFERKRLLGQPVKDSKGALTPIPAPPDTPYAQMITKLAVEQIEREVRAAQGVSRVVPTDPIEDQLPDDDMPTDTFDGDGSDVDGDGYFHYGPIGAVVPT